MAEGCPEGIDWAFLRWIIGYRGNLRPEILDMLNKLPERVTVHYLTRPAAVDGFLAGL